MDADGLDLRALAHYLQALANPVRLDILEALRQPKAAADLTIRPHRQDQFSESRAVSRQTLIGHLDKLEAVGLVRQVPDEGGGAARWLTNVPHIFAIIEDLAKLTAIPAHDLLELEETTVMADGRVRAWPDEPAVVVLNGPWRGRALPLRGEGPWTIGRSRSANISLHYDPFVSSRHATLRASPELTLIAEHARNPVQVNMEPLQEDEDRRLVHGDIVALGRSWLLVRNPP